MPVTSARKRLWICVYITKRLSSVDSAYTDFQSSLQKLFKEDLATGSGSFSYSRACPEAPNPCITIKGLGTVGLPLNVRDAEAIKTKAEQAPFGKANRTVVDKTVRDTWEIDSKLVRSLTNIGG